MKTIKRITNRIFLSSQLFIVLLYIVSCGNSSESVTSTDGVTSEVETQVEAPKQDIFGATFMGNVKVVKQHIKAGTDLNMKDQYGSTPLMIATTFGKAEIAKALIEGGADLHVTSADGSTALHTAAFLCRTEIVEELLKNGANKDLVNNYGSTPLASISGPFGDVKPIYDQLSKDLGPFGFKLDYDQIESTRPKIAKLLSQVN